MAPWTSFQFFGRTGMVAGITGNLKCKNGLAGSTQRFLSIHAAVQNVFSVQRHLLPRSIFKTFRAEAFGIWRHCCLLA